jgi:hypothetical protein
MPDGGSFPRSLELGEVFNLTNRRNWIGHNGNLRSAQFGRLTATTSPREVQLGIRVDY